MIGGVVRRAKQLLKRVLRHQLSKSSPGIPPRRPEYWGLTITPTGGLALDGVDLHALGQEHGLPVHIVQAGRLRENARRFQVTPPGCAAGCEVFYSYKTNPVPGVLTQLHASGVGAEVISHYELWLALELGVPPERIVFNGPAKSEAGIADAIRAGVQILNINHDEEIDVVAKVAKELGRRPRVGIRITVGAGWTAQFGIPVEGGRALAAFERAIRSPHLDVVGLHAHRGGMIRSELELRPFVAPVLAFAETVRERLGVSLEVLNLGGSLGTPTVQGLSARDVRLNRTFHRELPPADPAASLSIDRYVEIVVGMVEQFYAERGCARPRIFLEPGRAITGDAQMLLAGVVGTKRDDATTFAILNAGINLAESCRSEYHQLFAVNHAAAPATHTYTVVGPICTPGDTLYWAARLPPLTTGDSILIMDAGAYFIPFSTSFSFPRPPVLLVDAGVVTSLRRRERFEDLIAYD
jgi:diaminopimelate decarboxylase